MIVQIMNFQVFSCSFLSQQIHSRDTFRCNRFNFDVILTIFDFSR